MSKAFLIKYAERVTTFPQSWLILAALFGMGFVLNMGVSNDPIHYLDIARNLAAGKGAVTYNLNLNVADIPTKQLIWPPLYPMAIAALSYLGFGIEAAVRAVSILAFMTVSMCVYLIGKRLRTPEAGLICIVYWIVVSRSLNIFRNIWSEPIFMAFVSCFLVGLVCICTREHKIKSIDYGLVALTGVCAGLAALSRYQGLLCLPTAAVAVLVAIAFTRLKIIDGIKIVTVISVFFGVTTAPWIIRQIIVQGKVMSYLTLDSMQNPLSIGAVVLDVVLHDLCFPIWIAAGLGLVVMMKRRSINPIRNNERGTVLIIGGLSLLSWCAIYGAAFIYSKSIYQIDAVGTRFMAPLYPAAVSVLAVLTASIAERLIPWGGAIKLIRTLTFAVLFALGVQAIVTGYRGYIGNDGALLSGYVPNEKFTAWVSEQNVDNETLVIGENPWRLRFYTGTSVLGGNYPEYPNLTAEGIAEFLKTHRSWKKVFLYQPQSLRLTSDILEVYSKAGYRMEERYEDQDVKAFELVNINKWRET